MSFVVRLLNVQSKLAYQRVQQKKTQNLMSTTLSQSILKAVNETFKKADKSSVIDQLESITLDHVMADSEYNLLNTRLAVVQLSNGDMNELIAMTKAAKTDFRDVISWAMCDNK